MTFWSLRIATGLAAAALLTAGQAYAQSGEFRLGGGEFEFSEFEGIPTLTLTAGQAGDTGSEAQTGEEPGLEAVDPANDTGTASALPWYERFTVSTPTNFRSAWGDDATEFRFSAGERWGFTLGFTEQERGPQFQLDDMSAGAFYELSDRFRVGTNLRFSSPTEDVFGEQGEERAPELKFESAFRF